MNREFEPACRRMEWLHPFYKQVWEKAFADGIPISGTFELTPRCNFNCRMCYVHLKPEQIPKYGTELTAKQWIRIAEEAKEAGTTWLCITGGEPLLHPEFRTIYTELSQMGFFITLQTNGSLLEGERLELLEKYPPRGVKITLYGSDDAVYQDVCQVPNGFTRVDYAIKELKERKIPIQLVSTIIQQNEKDVKNMAFYAYRNGMPWAMTEGIKPSARGAENEAKQVRIERDKEKMFVERLRYMIKEKPFDQSRKPCTYCKDYRLGYWVTWEGSMRFCSFMNEPNIPVRDMPFLDAWKQLLLYEETLDWPKECQTCGVREGCSKCAGILASESGSATKVNPEFCSRIKQYYDEKKGEWKI